MENSNKKVQESISSALKFNLRAFKVKHGLYKAEEECRKRDEGKTIFQLWDELIERGGL